MSFLIKRNSKTKVPVTPANVFKTVDAITEGATFLKIATAGTLASPTWTNVTKSSNFYPVAGEVATLTGGVAGDLYYLVSATGVKVATVDLAVGKVAYLIACYDSGSIPADATAFSLGTDKKVVGTFTVTVAGVVTFDSTQASVSAISGVTDGQTKDFKQINFVIAVMEATAATVADGTLVSYV